jgi:hypothetical protein
MGRKTDIVRPFLGLCPSLTQVMLFAFHDREEIGPKMLARIARRTGLTPDDL